MTHLPNHLRFDHFLDRNHGITSLKYSSSLIDPIRSIFNRTDQSNLLILLSAAVEAVEAAIEIVRFVRFDSTSDSDKISQINPNLSINRFDFS